MAQDLLCLMRRASLGRATVQCLYLALAVWLSAPAGLQAQTYLVHGRVLLNYKSSPSYASSGCNGGPFSALFDVRIYEDPEGEPAGGHNWADIVTNIQQYVVANHSYGTRGAAFFRYGWMCGAVGFGEPSTTTMLGTVVVGCTPERVSTVKGER